MALKRAFDELTAVAELSLGLGLVQLVVESTIEAANRARQLPSAKSAGSSCWSIQARDNRTNSNDHGLQVSPTKQRRNRKDVRVKRTETNESLSRGARRGSSRRRGNPSSASASASVRSGCPRGAIPLGAALRYRRFSSFLLHN